jgi:hypothetical protein
LRHLSWCRLAVGPLAFGGFFLPWAEGPGALAGRQFSGFALVGITGRLQALDLTLAQGGTLWLVRLAILGVAIAGLWQALLAPSHRWHLGYAVSGWYIVGAALVCFALGLARGGFSVPPSGLALVGVAAFAFLAGRLASQGVASGDKSTVE